MKKEITPQTPKKSGFHIEWGKFLYMGFLCAIMLVAMSVPAFAATPTIWEKATEIMKDVYTVVFLKISEELWCVACYLISERASQRSIHTIE